MIMAVKEENPNNLLMPLASAVWLVDNTGLTFKQIADFTGFDHVKVEAIANGDVGQGIQGRDPIRNNELTQEELERAQKDPKANLVRVKSDLPQVKSRSKGPRYTPVNKRGDKPDAIAFILKNNPEISDAQICKLVGTTKPTIEKVRDKTHPNTSTMKPRHPAELQLCTYKEYEKAVDKGLKAQGKDPEAIRAEREAANKAVQDNNFGDVQEDDGSSSKFDFSNFLGTGNDD